MNDKRRAIRWESFLSAKAIVVALIGAALYILVGGPLPGGPTDAGAAHVRLHNATDVHVRVWENTEGYSYLVTELDPGETETVFWMSRTSPTYRIEDLNHQTIYCGPYPRGTYGPGSNHQGALAVEITRVSSIPTEVLNGTTFCQPPPGA